MSAKELPKFISDRLDRIIVENGFRDYSLEIKQGSKIGDGFMSDITSISIAERNIDRKLDLVCKMAPLNKNQRKEFISDVGFKNEIMFYEHAP